MDKAGEQAEEAQRQFLARAEEVLAKHAETYRNEVPSLIEKMDALALEMENTETAVAFSALKRIAHDMKGQGAMFGLPDFATVATSLSLLLSKGSRTHAHYFAAITLHIETLKRLPLQPVDPQFSPNANLIAQVEQKTDLVLRD